MCILLLTNKPMEIHYLCVWLFQFCQLGREGVSRLVHVQHISGVVCTQSSSVRCISVSDSRPAEAYPLRRNLLQFAYHVNVRVNIQAHLRSNYMELNKSGV